MKLVCLNTELQGREFHVEGDMFTIGRSPDCDVIMDQGSVSRMHAQVTLEGGRYVIRDLNSRNGIQVGGQRVQEGVVKPGDVVFIGDVEVQAVFDAPPLPQAMPKPPPTKVSDAPPPLPPAAPPEPALAPEPGPSAFQPPGLGAAPGAGAPPAPLPPDDQARSSALAFLWTLVSIVILALAGAYIFLPAQKGAKKIPVVDILMKRGEQRAQPLVARGMAYDPESVTLSEEGVVKVIDEIKDPKIIVLEAIDSGTVDVNVKRLNGSPMILRVIVRGSMPDLTEQFDRRLNNDQRLEIARENVLRANTLRKTELYRAIQFYKTALALMDPLPVKPPLYMETKLSLKRAERELQSKWVDLRFKFKQKLETNDAEAAAVHLREMQSLFPDERDWRRQVVDIYTQLIEQQLERQARIRK